MELAAAQIDGVQFPGNKGALGGPVDHRFSLAITFDQACLAQDPEMVGQKTLFDKQPFAQLADRAGFKQKHLHHRQSCSVRKNL